MTDPCKKGTSVKILRNVVKIKTGRKTKLTKKNICEVYTNIQEGKLLLPPLVLTPDRMYLLDKKSPFNSNDYEKLFDRFSSRVTLKKLAEKINIKKVDTLTKKQLTDTILKRLQFLNISEPVKLSKRSSVAAAKRPAAVQSTAVKNTVQKRPAAVQSTAAKVVTIFKGPNVPEKPLVPEQAKVVLGNRNYDLLFDPKTKREDLLRIANKVGVENTENMTKKELIEATTKRVRFMSNRGLTPKNIKSGAKVPFFPKPPNRPPPITTPAFLQQKSGPVAGGPPVGGPPGGTPNFLKGRTVVPGPAPIPPRPSNVKPNNVKPNNVKPSTTNTGTGNNNVKPSTTNSGTGNNNAKPSTTNTGTGNNNVRPNAPPPKKSGKSFFNYFRGGKKNAAATVPAKSGKSFFNYFKGGKKNAAATVPAKSGKSFFNYFKGGKKNVNVKPNSGIGKNTLPPNVNPPPINVKPNKIENNMTEELINNAVNNEISNSVRKNRAKPKNNNNFNAAKELNKQLNNEAKRQNRAKNKNNNNFNATKEFNKQMAIRNMTDELITNAVNEELNNEISNSKPNNNFNATKEFNKQMTVRNMTDELITNAVNEELNKEISNSRLNNMNLNNATKNIIRSINKATTLKELRKIYLKGALKLHPNTGGNKDAFSVFMNAHTKKQTLLEAGNTKSNVNYVANGIMKEINKDVRNQITNGSKNNKVLAIANKPNNNKNADVEYVANQILKQLQNDVAKEIRLGGRAAEPIYNNSSNSNNNNNKNKKTTQNNPLFEPNMQNNPMYSNNNNNSFNGGPRLGANNNNVSLPPSKNVVNVNNIKVNINNVPKEVEQQENNVRNIIKNMNSERDKLKNKITKELNLIPNNNGVFQERTGLTKGRIGLWARELRAAETIEDLKKIENKLNAKVVLRKNIENKYTKAGLTKVEKMNHRRKVVKLLNNVNKRREEIEMQVKNRNNNKNSVISNYNSNANNDPNRAKKMKYKSRENFVEAKKVELRELAKKTSTNFGRNIDRMQTRQNVFKLRGRIKGAIKRDEGLSKLGNNKK